MKLLIWESKHGIVVVCAHTPEEEDRVWLYLFGSMDKMGYYSDLGDDEDDAYRGAKEGKAKDAKWLLETHNDYEYERISIKWVIEP